MQRPTAVCKYSGVVGPCRVDVPGMSWCPSLVPFVQAVLEYQLQGFGHYSQCPGKVSQVVRQKSVQCFSYMTSGPEWTRTNRKNQNSRG